MTNRHFTARIRAAQQSLEIAPGRFINAYVLKCGTCGAPGHVANVRDIGPENAVKKFAEKGWVVGKSAGEDRCPVHNPLKAPRPPKENRPMEAPPAAIVAAKRVATAPERVRTREDSRLIIAKLEEVWAGESTGYRSGWSDHKVATDMNVPRVWVEELREEFFGSARDNDDVRQLLAEAAKAREEFTRLAVDVSRASAQVTELQNRLTVQRDVLDRIEREGRAISKATGAK